MGLLTEKDFQRDTERELDRYQTLIELGVSEDAALAGAADSGGPWTLWHHIPSDCFLCGRKLLLPFIYWHGGNDQMIGLHIQCGEHFIEGITKDLMKN